MSVYRIHSTPGGGYAIARTDGGSINCEDYGTARGVLRRHVLRRYGRDWCALTGAPITPVMESTRVGAAVVVSSRWARYLVLDPRD